MKNSKVYDRPIKPFPEYVQKDITYKLHTLLLALLRPTITPSILQPNILNLSEEDWTRLFTLAAQHGVTALLFDTILRLPEQQQPSRALKIRWALSSEAIEKRHAQQTRAAHELTTLFASHGVRTILLKGLGLSIYYPRPEHRECGDIDLWLDDCDKGNRLIEELGIKINYDSEKHAVFHYKGVMVENHSHLLMPSHRRTERAIDDFLVGEAENSRLAPAGYYTPSPMFNALYLLRHMARHFGTEGITSDICWIGAFSCAASNRKSTSRKSLRFTLQPVTTRSITFSRHWPANCSTRISHRCSLPFRIHSSNSGY